MEKTSDKNYPDLDEQVTSVNGRAEVHRGTLNPSPGRSKRAWECTGVAGPRSTHDPTDFLSNVRPGNAGISATIE
jgi:hypothetical protein